MAFTTSHPAAVLAFNYLPKRWFSLTGLVIGSMIPDFEYFIRMTMETKYSHTFWGMFWFDLPLSLLFMLIYNGWVKDKLIDHLPGYLNRRFSVMRNSGRPYFKRPLLIVAVSILIGTASHLFWDSFTHRGRYFVRHISILTNSVSIAGHPVLVYNIVQHISTLVGAIVIVYATAQLPVSKLTKTQNIGYYWIKIIAVTVLFLIIRLFMDLSIHLFGDVIVTTVSGLLIGLIIVSIFTPTAENENV